MTGRVVVTQPLLHGAIAPLRAAGLDLELLSAAGPPLKSNLVHAVQGACALICLLNDVVDDEVLAAGAPTLRVVANVAVGVDNIDLDAATRRGVAVCNTPGVLDAATADLAIALLLAVCRRVTEGMDLIRSGGWSGFSAAQALGRDLAGMRLGIVGYGRIGAKVAERAHAFEMEVRHCNRRDTGLPGFVGDLDELLATSDAISLHVPLTDETRHLLDARRISLLPQGAVVVNTARGPVIDEAALVAALRDGRLGGAGLDVYEEEPFVSLELQSAPNVVLTPHIGSATVETRTAMCRTAVEGVLAVLEGRAHPHFVVPPGGHS